MTWKAFRIPMWIAALAAAGGALWFALRPTPVPCDVVRIDRGPLVVAVEEDGRTRLKERYVVAVPIAGTAERIALKAGDEVVQGSTVLTRIVPAGPSLLDERAKAQAEAQVRVCEASLQRAEAEAARWQAELEHVQAEFERMRAAADAGAASKFELEDERVLVRTTENSANAAQFARSMAVFELEQARAALLEHAAVDGAGALRGAFEVRSPITGKVLRVIRESGGPVSLGEALVELGSLDDLEIEVDVLSDQAVRVRPGQRVMIGRWGGERPLDGVVRLVEPSGFTKVSALGVEEQRVNVLVDFLDPREKRPTLGDGFRVESSIVVLEKPDVLRVPVGALVRLAGGWAVFAVRDGRSVALPVTVGERSGQFAELLDGVAADETVIVFPSDRIEDGGRVAPRSS